ncbi:hypothetical protein H8E77_34685, partial [bacterium]|nr:hypothetical protein [bacterium]
QNLSDVVNENIKCIRLCSLRSPTPSAYGQGKLWLGTTTGMIEFQPETNVRMTYRSQKTVEPLLESNVENIELDGDYIWFSNWAASKNGGIIRYNKSTGTWQRYTRIDILHGTKSQSMTNIRRIYVDDSDVWFATDYGALRYEKASDTWTHYTTEDGLSSNELSHIAVSASSVWMSDAGGGGISRYDKKAGTWTSLSLESKFPFESITCIAADGDDIWFALETGVHKFNETTGTFRKYTQKDGLAGDGAAWICADGDDIWIARSDWGGRTPKALSRYNKSTGKWKIYSSTDVLSERYLVKIIRGKKYLWILYHPFAEAGITRYDKRTDEWITIKPQADWGGGVTELAEDGDYIWLATMGNGVHRYHFASGTWISYDEKNELMHNHINDRALKVDGNYIWVGTPRGLSRYDKRDESWTILTEAKTMVGKEVRAVAADSRYVWCGTPVGLSRYDKEYGTWMNFRKRGGMQEMRFGYSTWRWYEPESEEGLINSWVTCLSVDDQYVWIGTRGGANRYDKIADVWDRYTPKNGLPSDDMTTVASDGNTVWMGTNFGLGRFPRTSDDENAWVSYTSGIEIKPGALSKEYAEALVSNEIWCLAADKKYVWIGTKLGVSRYDKRKDMWKTFTTEDGLSSNKVNSIAIQGDYVWFGSDLGVSVYDHKKGDWIHLTQKDGFDTQATQPKGLASNRITSIAINGNDVWIGTLDAGVSRYNTEEKTWRSYRRADGLAHNGIFAISCDVDGSNIWFGTHRGLSRYNKNTDTWTTYTEHYDSEDI